MFPKFLKDHKWDLLIGYIVAAGFVGVALAIAHYGFNVDFKVDDPASLGQALLEFLILPAAFIGILFAAEEFRKLQAAPALDLRITAELTKESTWDHLTYFTGHPEEGRYTADFYVINEGTAIAQWFEVEMLFPIELFGTREPDEILESWYKVAAPDDKSHWEVSGKPSGKQYNLRVHFKSNGKIGAFLEQELHLGWLQMIPHIDQDITYEIPYKIVPARKDTDSRDTDKEDPDGRKLLIHFKAIDLGI